MDCTPETIRQRDRSYVWHPWSSLDADRSQLTLSRGNGYRVWDIDGKEYIDASSLNITCGYRHPHLIDAINQQLQKLHSFDLTIASHEPAGLLAEKLTKYLPNGLSKTLFVNSGSEGFEAAIFIAASYWAQVGEKRTRIVSFERGYHGSTLISRSLSGLDEVKHPFDQPVPITHVKLPMPPRQLRHPESCETLLNSFKKAFDSNTESPPMCVVIEPFLNVGGGIVLPQGFLQKLRKLCDETGVLLILDEVFTGYGRTGKMFAFQHENISPDVLVSSKGLASGYMPITAVTVQERIHDTFEKDSILKGLRFGHTTSGHAVSCIAALATLNILEAEKLSLRAEINGKLLLEKLVAYTGFDNVVDIRGFGLIIVLEMTSPKAASQFRARAQSMGLLLRQNGEVLMIVPPLTIDDEGIKSIVECLHLCFIKEGKT